MSLADLKSGLATVTADSPVVVTIQGGTTYMLVAGDLDTPLGVTPLPPPLVIAYQVTVNVPVGQTLNLRKSASTSAAILETLAHGTTLDVIAPGTPIAGGSYQWLHVCAPDKQVGYVAQQFTTKVVLPSVLGLHSLLDGRSKVEAFIAAGAKLASITIVGDTGYANLMAQSVGTVIYRPWPDVSPTIPDDDASAETYGSAFIDQMFARLDATGDLDLQPDIYIQPVNEPTFKIGSNGFWLGCMKNLTARGRKCAMGAYAVGGPEPADWQTMETALAYCKANNHIVCLHAYSKDGTPAGQLSDPNDLQYYEMRFVRLYGSVPISAQPPLVISEFAGQFKTGQFQGTDALLSVATAYKAATAQYNYLIGINLWTAGAESGEWASSSIDTALTDQRTIALFS